MKNIRHKIEVFLIIVFWVWSCNGGFSQSFYSTVSGSCASDGQVELGTKFTTSANATITALRFYKCSPGTELYTLKLYSGTTLLTSGTYTGTATGWINVTIPSVSIIPGVNYTVSYYASTGRYQAVSTYSYPVTNGPLTASGSVYGYKTTNSNSLPNLTYQTSNYFADVVLQNNVPNNVHDTIYLHDTLTKVLPCYPPDSSLVITNGNTIEKYFYFFKTVYRDTGRIVYNNVYIRDTIYVPVHDTAYLPKVCPTDSQHYSVIHDTIYAQCRDTSHVLFGYDGLDTTNYKLPSYKNYKIFEFTTFDGVKARYVRSIIEGVRLEEWDEVTKTWKYVAGQ